MSKTVSNNSAGGYTDSRGEWRPEKPISYAPIFVFPPRLKAFLGWLFKFLFTANLFYLAVVLLSYYFFQPALEQMKTFKLSWISVILVRNMTLVWLIYGGWHLYLYTYKKRGTTSKYSPRWQSTNGSTFLWNDQVYDNVFWSCAFGVPIWSAYEVITFWLYANDKIPYLDFREHPLLFIMLFLLVPFWREFHFYVIHRIIHWKPLYKSIHYLHHYNINPGPWSGLAMHPVEHLLYFSVMAVHWIVPSHPLHFMFNSQLTALTPAPGHSGFEGKLGKLLSFGSYFHYLHHRLFECNYGQTKIPLDKWFGIFEDGAQTQTEKNEAASMYHKLRVDKIIDESPEVRSFYLKSVDNLELKKNIPGQHLTFRFPFHDKDLYLNDGNTDGVKINYALRSYTISNTCANSTYRISVKKEDKGKVSSALHNTLKAGDVVEAKGPKGNFVFNKKKRHLGVFIAGGIGITPILSMLKGLEKTYDPIYVFLSVREERLFVFKEEIQAICDEHPNIVMNVFFSDDITPDSYERFPDWKINEGMLSMEKLKFVLPIKKKFDIYLCGPAAMNDFFAKGINAWKGRKAKVNTENFGGKFASRSVVAKDVQIHFIRSNKTLKWDNEYTNLLEFAESNGVSMEAGCTFGECGACSVKIHKGEVGYNYHTAVKPVKRNCLPCSCHPTSDIELNA